MKKLLHWRKGNDVISKGKMKHFMPRNNIYVYERSYNGKSILVVMNGVNKEVDWDLAHYKEVIGNKTDARNVLTDTDVKLGAIIRLQPKEVLMLELCVADQILCLSCFRRHFQGQLRVECSFTLMLS